MPTAAPYPVTTSGSHAYITIGGVKHDVTFGSSIPPFTAAQIAKMRSWMQASGSGQNDLSKIPDSGIPYLYQIAARQGKLQSIPGIDQGPLQAFGHTAPGATSITQFLGMLSDSNTWLRVGEFLLGAILLGIGVAHLFPATQSALKSVPVYGKAMP